MRLAIKKESKEKQNFADFYFRELFIPLFLPVLREYDAINMIFSLFTGTAANITFFFVHVIKI